MCQFSNKPLGLLHWHCSNQTIAPALTKQPWGVFAKWAKFGWWRYQMETFSALLFLCAENSPITGKFPSERPVTRSFDVFFDLRLNKPLSKHSWGCWIEMLSRSLWRHRHILCLVIFCYELIYVDFATKPTVLLYWHCGTIAPALTKQPRGVFAKWAKFARWRHQMETFSALLAICVRNSPVTAEFPEQKPVTQSFDVFFDLRLNKPLSKQSWGWWFETPSRSLWRHYNVHREKRM